MYIAFMYVTIGKESQTFFIKINYDIIISIAFIGNV